MVCFGLQLRGKRGNVYILERNKHLICKIHLVSLSSFPLPLPLLLLLYTHFKEFLSINALCTFVHIYIWQLSSFRAPTLWFIGLTVATCHIQYTFLSLWQFFFNRRWTKCENTQSSYENGRRRLLGMQSIKTERASLICPPSFDMVCCVQMIAGKTNFKLSESVGLHKNLRVILRREL